MMEFTVNGIVRQAFGFSNPNHAAALFCVLIPLCWGWRKFPWLGYCLSILLTVPLAMTFSRTGILVLAFECVAYRLLSHKHSWKWMGLFAGIGLLAFALVGMHSRLSLDKAVTNRPQIWLAGVMLSAASPLGVGLGNSGKIASAFLLDGISVRTLVNSHLTLLCELGLPAAFFWGVFIVYALVNGTRRTAAWCSFAGLCISTLSSSVFDWHVLFDFQKYGGLPLSNFILSWLTLGLFVALGLFLCIGKITPRKALSCTILPFALCCILFVFYRGDTPKIRDGLVILNCRSKEKSLFLYDGAWELRDVRQFIDANSCTLIPLASSEGISPESLPSTATVVLFGECGGLAASFPDASLVFVSPPEYMDFPGNTHKVYLKRYVEERFLQGTWIRKVRKFCVRTRKFEGAY